MSNDTSRVSRPRVERTLIAAAARGTFAFAKWRDERARRHAAERQLRTVASQWEARAGISSQTAVGINPDAPLPAVLLGLRLGACRLDIPCKIQGLDSLASVGHDVVRGRDLRVVVRPRVPFQHPGWPVSPHILEAVRHVESSLGRQTLLEDVSIGQLWHDDDLEPCLMGTTSLVELGERDVVSQQWSAHVLGAFEPGDRWKGMLAEAQVAMEVYPAEPRRTAAAALALSPKLGALRPVAESLTWRQDSIAPDVARLMLVQLEFPRPVTSSEAEMYLLDNVCRLLHLYAGARPTVCGLWDPQERTGRLIDLGRALVSGRRRVVGNSVTLNAFMSEVAPAWGVAGTEDKKNVKIGMDALAAMTPDLEPGVVAGAMTLEFLSAAFLPKASNRYALSKSQRREISDGLARLASEIAAGTVWERDLSRIASRLWSAPAEDRISELASAFGIATDDAEISAYIKVRNALTHGRSATLALDEKVKAMQFQLHAGGVVLVRKVGFTGPVRDVRRHQLRAPRPGSRID